jgi:NAD(P)-dependent dehydrogenase (short-subunit alcohol dehydrogenase family)
MKMKLEGKVAMITGGNSGIGQATAALFASEGAAVVLTGRNSERGEEVAGSIVQDGGEAMFIRSDVRLAADCRQAVEQTLDRYGRIDILFNNAGVFHPKTVPECTEQEWDETIDSSLKGAFLMSKYALPSMIERGSGSIIHTSSGWGVLGGDGAAAYCAAKGGLIVMAKAMAIDHGPDGIRVNCVCPGDVMTPMLPDDARKRDMEWEDYLAGASDRPLGRIGTGSEQLTRSPAQCSSWPRTTRPS